MRNMQFFSLKELNAEIQKHLISYNNVLFQRKESSRRELFQAFEKPLLKPLAPAPYQIKEYAQAKVQKMGYIYLSIDKTYYSVPYRFIGSQTQIQYSAKHVEVYHKYERIALHERIKRPGTYITNKDHLSSTHRYYSDWSPQYFTDKARKVGINVELFMTGLFQRANYPEINYKRANGILQLAKTYGDKRVDKACLRAVFNDAYSYQMIKNILQNNMDDQQIEQLQNETSHIPDHENIRGAAHYQ
jgi:transposase